MPENPCGTTSSSGKYRCKSTGIPHTYSTKLLLYNILPTSVQEIYTKTSIHPTPCLICLPPQTKTQQQDLLTASSRGLPTVRAFPTPEGDGALAHELLAGFSSTQIRLHPGLQDAAPSSPHSAGGRARLYWLHHTPSITLLTLID